MPACPPQGRDCFCLKTGGSGSVHMSAMSDSTAPEPRITATEFDNLIEATKTTYDGWLERLVKNGPDDLTAAQEVAANAARYNHLRAIKRGYLS